MAITAALVKELREQTGVGMMECKKALVETDGDIDAARELLRKRGQASAEKKAGRIAAEGRIEYVSNADAGVIVEVNCETDFVAKDENFLEFARLAANLALEHSPADVDQLMGLATPAGSSLEETRKELVVKIGENINVRRFQRLSPKGSLGAYLHGLKIGVLVDVEGGDDELRKDLAMHVAATNPRYVSADDVAKDEVDGERRILSEQAEGEGKPPEIVAKMVEGRLRKYLNEITLLGQPFVKDPDVSVGKLIGKSGATVHSFVRLEVGEGIEKKVENFAEEVQAQLQAQN